MIDNSNIAIYQNAPAVGKLAGDKAYADYMQDKENVNVNTFKARDKATEANKEAQNEAFIFNKDHNLDNPAFDKTIYQDPIVLGKIAGDKAYADSRSSFGDTLQRSKEIATEANQNAQKEDLAFNLKYNLTKPVAIIYQDPELAGKIAGDKAYADYVQINGNYIQSTTVANEKAKIANQNAQNSALAFNLKYNLTKPIVISIDTTVYQDPKLAGKIAGDLAYKNSINDYNLNEEAQKSASDANKEASNTAKAFNLKYNLTKSGIKEDITVYQNPKIKGREANNQAYIEYMASDNKFKYSIIQETFKANNVGNLADKEAQQDAINFNLYHNLINLVVLPPAPIYQDPELAGKIAGDKAYADYMAANGYAYRPNAQYIAAESNKEAFNLAKAFNLKYNLAAPSFVYQDPKVKGTEASKNVRVNFKPVNKYNMKEEEDNAAILANVKAQNDANAFNREHNLHEPD